jgi:hypothetical protein
MSGWQMILVQAAIFLIAVGGIGLFTLLTLRFAGPAMNRNRAPASRALHGLAAAACVCGIVASAALGFGGLAAVLYIAQR